MTQQDKDIKEVAQAALEFNLDIPESFSVEAFDRIIENTLPELPDIVGRVNISRICGSGAVIVGYKSIVEAYGKEFMSTGKTPREAVLKALKEIEE